MEAKTKKRLLIAGGIGLVVLLMMRKSPQGVAVTRDDLKKFVDGMNVPGLNYSGGQYTIDNPFNYAGGGANMFLDGPRITWPAMNTLMPISVGGSNYRTGDLTSNNLFVGDFANNNQVSGGGCCCDDPADPTQTVSAAILVNQSAAPKAPWSGYGFQNPGYIWNIGGQV